MKTTSSRERMAIVCLVLTLFLMHALTLQHQSLFVDELEELTTAREPLRNLVFKSDSMPPFYSLLLHGWLGVFISDASARWLSVAISLTSTVLVWQFTRRWMTESASLVATLLFAFCPLQLFYAQLIRAYALMILFAILCIGSFISAEFNHQRKAWIGFGVAIVLGMWTHYFFALIPMALALAWLIKRDWSEFSILWKVCLASILFCAPLLLLVQDDFTFQHDLRAPRPLSLSALGYTWLSYFSGYALGPSQRELQSKATNAAFWEGFEWSLVVGLASSPLLYLGVRELWRRRWMIVFVPLVAVTFVSLAMIGVFLGITYNVRFVSWLVFPVSVVFALAWNEKPSRVLAMGRSVSLAFVLLIFCLANYNRIYNPRYQIEDMRSVAQHLLASDLDSSPVYVVSDYMSLPLNYYLGKQRHVVELPVPGRRSQNIDETSDVEPVLNLIASNAHPNYWLIYSRAFHGDPKGLLLTALKKTRISLETEFAGVEIYRGDAARITLFETSAGPK